MSIKQGDRVIIHTPGRMEHLQKVECEVIEVREYVSIVKVVSNKAFNCVCRNKKGIITAKLHHKKDSLIGTKYKIVTENLLLINAKEYFQEKYSSVTKNLNVLNTDNVLTLNKLYLETERHENLE